MPTVLPFSDCFHSPCCFARVKASSNSSDKFSRPNSAIERTCLTFMLYFLSSNRLNHIEQSTCDPVTLISTSIFYPPALSLAPLCLPSRLRVKLIFHAKPQRKTQRSKED